MSEIRLNVPLLAQSRTMSCWYAAVCMVNYYWEAGPRLGLPRVFEANSGISPAQHRELARNENLAQLNSASHEFTASSLIATVRQYGPIWADGDWYGVAHIIVVTGASTEGDGGGTVFLNDPDGGVAREGTIEWFNRERWRGGMMVRDPRSRGSHTPH
ncbi:papain-like cysteine protease family protein [Tropicimonas sp. IMCC6043]|uniref:papain-like cysteine protease family protein n=1 Tax=Tropicimonas sp. IMCC6043 TaxID=2510645 RepID=UPI0013EE3370|nr:papain-like cysteine protease family protein [Tropicimonas sp. IMCC6043]